VHAVQQGSAIMRLRGYPQEYIAPTCLLVASLFPNQTPARQLPLKDLDSAQSPVECGPLLDRWGMNLLREGGFEPNPAVPDVDTHRLTLARWLMVRRPGLLPQYDVLSFLDRQLIAARQQRLASVAIEILVMKALLHQANKRSLPAIDALHGALALAEPEGYTRLFIEFGRDLPPLLRKLIERSTQATLSGAPEQSDITEQAAAYATHLLECFEEAPPAAQSGQPMITPPSASAPVGQVSSAVTAANNSEETELPGAPVLLTPREIDVLRLLAEGLANKDIAARLYLSINTVRIHSSNLYAKLEVANRTQAVARARALGYLD
jgi:LuxR family maltose regulon positive regulatory protein